LGKESARRFRGGRKAGRGKGKINGFNASKADMANRRQAGSHDIAKKAGARTINHPLTWTGRVKEVNCQKKRKWPRR